MKLRSTDSLEAGEDQDPQVEATEATAAGVTAAEVITEQLIARPTTNHQRLTNQDITIQGTDHHL